MRRLLLCLAALLCLLGAMPAAQGLSRHRQQPPPPTVPPPPAPPKAWIVVDDDTGAVIEAGSEHQPMLPASVSKILTALIAVQQLPTDAEVPITAVAQGMPARNMNMKVGQVWKFQDALHALLMVSANDAAVAIAERVAGSRENFSAVMARTAERLHMQDHPVLNDPAGLDDEFSVGGGNRISAFDLAVATRAAMAVEQIRAVVATQVYRFHGPDNNDHRLLNHNLMLKTYPGGIGVKTGYTKRAGHSLITAATRDGRTMVSVVLNAPDPDHFSAALLDKGFATPLAAEAAMEHMPAVVPNASLDPAASQAPGLVRTPTAQAVPTQAEPEGGTDYARQVGWVGLAVIPVSIMLLRRRVVRRRRYLFR